MDKLFIFILSLIFQNLFFILKFRKSRNNEKNHRNFIYLSKAENNHESLFIQYMCEQLCHYLYLESKLKKTMRRPTLLSDPLFSPPLVISSRISGRWPTRASNTYLKKGCMNEVCKLTWLNFYLSPTYAC